MPIPVFAPGPQLMPLPNPVGLFDDFIAKQTETLILVEGMFSLGGSFDITLANGVPLLQVRGKVLSLSNRKSVYDMANNHLFDIQKEYFHLFSTFALNGPSGVRIGQVKSRFAFFGTKAAATFVSKTGKPESLLMKGDFFDFSANIVDESNGAIVAQIDRKVSLSSLLGKRTYKLIVAPGADMVLLVAMCICLEEKRAQRSRNAALS